MIINESNVKYTIYTDKTTSVTDRPTSRLTEERIREEIVDLNFPRANFECLVFVRYIEQILLCQTSIEM